MSRLVRPAVAVGIFGKLPARGDFVRSGLPRDFVDGWDDWLSATMSATQEHAGGAWLQAFLEAPIWRFTLPPGLCGAGAVIGLIMPSVDRAGRYFPLTLAAVREASGFAIDAVATDWLDRCEDAGFAALEKDAGPAAIEAMIGVPNLLSTTEAGSVSNWWTNGSPRVPSGRMELESLPTAAVLGTMLGTLPTAERHAGVHMPENPLA